MADTYGNLYLNLRNEMREMGIAAADLEARVITCAASNKSKEEYIRDYGKYAADDVKRKIREMLARRMRQEPVAYIAEEWEFYGIPLYVNPSVLIPRQDTEVLIDKAIQVSEKNCKVLDLCAGSGCIGIAIAENIPGSRVILADISEEALKVCRANIRRHELGTRVSCVKSDALASPSAHFWKFDLIVCNPPYIPTKDIETLDPSVKDFEPVSALDGGDDGLMFYRNIAKEWKKVLAPNGYMIFECGIGQAQIVSDIMRAEGFGAIETTKDTLDIDRVITGKLILLEEEENGCKEENISSGK